jgi:alpha-D-xyloside xylohydrolase
MVKELQEMGIELMVSIWPTVDRRSESYEEMLEKDTSSAPNEVSESP